MFSKPVKPSKQTMKHYFTYMHFIYLLQMLTQVFPGCLLRPEHLQLPGSFQKLMGHYYS